MQDKVKILFIQTGGTIDKDYPKTNDGYAFEIGEPAVAKILKKSHPDFEYEVVDLLQKDSLDLVEDDRQKLKQFILSSVASKIIVTHGSDTMADSANYVGLVKGKTIVFTGSYKPERFIESDADFNVGVAVGAVNVLGEGTFIAMNGKIMPSVTCYKNPLTGIFELK